VQPNTQIAVLPATGGNLPMGWLRAQAPHQVRQAHRRQARRTDGRMDGFRPTRLRSRPRRQRASDFASSGLAVSIRRAHRGPS
jgi:hypothetical protein